MERYCVVANSAQPEYAIGLLQAIEQITGDKKHETYLVAFNLQPKMLYPYFDWCIEVDDTRITNYDVANQVNCLEALFQQYKFDCILVLSTFVGRQLAPRLAIRLGTGVVADVTDITHIDGNVVLVRPAFDGKIYAAIKNVGPSPLVASIRPGAFRYGKEHCGAAQVIRFIPATIMDSGIKLLGSLRLSVLSDIRDSKVLVSGGGGTEQYFGKLEVLAKDLGGMVSASRHIVDSGIADRRIQVGHSGKTVSPSLYVALGIYGSLQHIEGLKDVETIISVNTNRNAPICSLSDVVVEGDAEQFIEMLHQRIVGEKGWADKNEVRVAQIMDGGTQMDKQITDFNMDYFSLRGKNAIVTGGNTGLGQAFSLALAKAGANIFMPSVMPDDPSYNALIEAEGGKPIYLQADITQVGMCEKVVKTCAETLGSVDILVNCAGICIIRNDVRDFDRTDWEKMIAINLTAAFDMSHECAKVMIPQRSGKIINICSMFTWLGGKQSPAYAASKHGIAGLTKAYCDELAEFNIQVNGIAPGYFRTAVAAASSGNTERNKWIIDHTPEGRWGVIHDLMGTMVFLASEASQFVNGHILAVDGGFLVR